MRTLRSLAAAAAAMMVATVALSAGDVRAYASAERSAAGNSAAPAAAALVVTADGRIAFPTRYREWIFLSSGIDMSYREERGAAMHSMFDNVFVDPAAYRAFLRRGTWPDGTVLVLEQRRAAEKGSINRHGKFQTRDVMGIEAHVKDSKRFAGGWAFVSFRGGEPGSVIPMSADCYSCHRQHGAVDTTFVQFYPTLTEVAARKGTLATGR